MPVCNRAAAPSSVHQVPPSLDSRAIRGGLRRGQSNSARLSARRAQKIRPQIALFWADGAGHRDASGPLEQYCADNRRCTRQHAGRKRKAVCLIEHRHGRRCHLRLGCQVTTSHFRRPVTAITFTEPELNWASFIVTPPFPDYVSGHSTFSGAAATVLPPFYGTDDLPFTTGSDFLPGVYRSFPTCLAAAEEAAVSRMIRGHSLPIGKRRWPGKRG